MKKRRKRRGRGRPRIVKTSEEPIFIYKRKRFYLRDIKRLVKSKCEKHPDYKYILVPEVAHPNCLQCHINWYYHIDRESISQSPRSNKNSHVLKEFSLDVLRSIISGKRKRALS